jgi:hypothetical protein
MSVGVKGTKVPPLAVQVSVFRCQQTDDSVQNLIIIVSSDS